jgi:hypothetical protein
LARCLSAFFGQHVLIEHEHEHDIPFGREVGDAFRDDGSALGPGLCRDLGIVGCPQPDLTDASCPYVSRRMAAVWGEHFVGQGSDHAGRASRFRDARRFRSASTRLCSMRRRIWSGCSAA